jgi:hypothetical protein
MNRIEERCTIWKLEWSKPNDLNDTTMIFRKVEVPVLAGLLFLI